MMHLIRHISFSLAPPLTSAKRQHGLTGLFDRARRRTHSNRESTFQAYLFGYCGNLRE